jgi:hypothetical protein
MQCNADSNTYPNAFNALKCSHLPYSPLIMLTTLLQSGGLSGRSNASEK